MRQQNWPTLGTLLAAAALTGCAIATWMLVSGCNNPAAPSKQGSITAVGLTQDGKTGTTSYLLSFNLFDTTGPGTCGKIRGYLCGAVLAVTQTGGAVSVSAPSRAPHGSVTLVLQQGPATLEAWDGTGARWCGKPIDVGVTSKVTTLNLWRC